jgi:hypothetical protein
MKSVQLKSVLAVAAIAMTSAANANITFGEFNLTAYDNSIELRWQTLSEFNSSTIRVERSFNGIDWFDLVTVPAAGDSPDPIDYYYADLSPLPGKNFYRLIAIDSLGNEVVGPTVMHDYTTMSVCDVVVYPNPADDNLLIYWEDCPAELRWRVSIISQQGFSMIAGVNNGAQFLQMDVSNFPTGMYKVLIQAQASRTTIKKTVYIN